MLEPICHVGFPFRQAIFANMSGHLDIADYIYSNPTLLDLKVQGLWLASRMVVQHLFSMVLMANSAMITEDAVAVEAPAVNFVHKNLNVFPFK